MLISNARRAGWRLASVALLSVGTIAASLVVAAQSAPQAASTQAASTQAASTPASPSRVKVDHQQFDALLRQHVVDGLVDYDAFARAPAFTQYLASLDRVRPEQLDDDERLAYWINVYNAYTIQLIVSHRETGSIRNINQALGFLQLKGPWSEPLVRAAGRQLTLDDVDHAIIRAEFGEPRIHFALSCAAMSCPPLRSEAYTGDRLVDQLNDQARRFLGESPAKNRVEQRILYLSPILLAYRTDFGPAMKDLGRSVAPWMQGVDSLLLKPRLFVRETRFDWTLNSQQQGRRAESGVKISESGRP